MLIDTHCHLNLIVKTSFDTVMTQNDYQKAKNIIDLAEKKEVKKILNIGTSFIESLNSIEIAKQNGNVYASIGIHPNDLKSDYKNEIKKLAELLREKENNKIVAVGEIGLDYHYPEYDKNLQYDAFKMQIEMALENNLSLSIHTRDAGDEVLKVLSQFKSAELKGVIHCFSEDLSFAYDAINLNFKLGIGGTITYPKNEKLRSVVQNVGLENIVLETDAPYLPVQSMRGKINYPENIYDIAKYVSELLNKSFEDVARITTKNAINLFKF